MDSNSHIVRLRVVFVVIALVALLLVYRLFSVQIVHGGKYKDLAEQQYSSTVSTLYDRGAIYFTKKDGDLISAAALKTGFTLAINPKVIEDVDHVYEVLSSHIEISEEEYLSKALKKNDPYEELATRLSQEQADKIASENLRGVGVYKERWRYYPAEKRAAHVVGFVGFKGEDFSGRYGIERYHDDILSRNTDGIYNNFFAEIFSGISSFLTSSTKHEADIVLTVEPFVQEFVEEQLKTIKNETGYDEAGAIIIDPFTGAISAMAAFPTFDPGKYFEEDDIRVFSNPHVENVYEFGSIVKPLTIAAALDAGALSESDTYDDKGFIELDGRRIANFDGEARGVVEIQEILNQSLNTGVAHAVEEMGKDTFREYMYAFGFDEKTRVDLPDEVNNLVDNLESSRDVEYATASFGQGIAVTPISMVRALSSLANGGYLIRPHVVTEIDYRGLPERKVRREEQGKPLTEVTSERISRMLTTVVDDALRGGTVSLENYSVAAKTGTAQIAAPEGGYYEDRFLHSFFGYFPSYDPEYLIFFYIVNPLEGRYASETLTEPFIDTVKFLANYYEIPPDR